MNAHTTARVPTAISWGVLVGSHHQITKKPEGHHAYKPHVNAPPQRQITVITIKQPSACHTRTAEMTGVQINS